MFFFLLVKLFISKYLIYQCSATLCLLYNKRLLDFVLYCNYCNNTIEPSLVFYDMP